MWKPPEDITAKKKPKEKDMVPEEAYEKKEILREKKGNNHLQEGLGAGDTEEESKILPRGKLSSRTTTAAADQGEKKLDGTKALLPPEHLL